MTLSKKLGTVGVRRLSWNPVPINFNDQRANLQIPAAPFNSEAKIDTRHDHGRLNGRHSWRLVYLSRRPSPDETDQ